MVKSCSLIQYLWPEPLPDVLLLVPCAPLQLHEVIHSQTHGHSDMTEDNIDTMVRLEPEGLNEEDNQSYTSYLSVDKRLFGKLQKELTQAHSDLKDKEEEVKKLSRIRDDVEREMEDLTASLFQVETEYHRLIASRISNKTRFLVLTSNKVEHDRIS